MASGNSTSASAALIVFAVVVVVLGGIVYFLAENNVTFSGGGTPSAAPAAPHVPDKIEAWVACKSFVEKRLKAPSTADFESYSQELVSEGGAGSFEVHGTVDAQNSFGAKLRSNFRCSLHSDQAGNWLLDSINIQ
jgi:hypothetical protein